MDRDAIKEKINYYNTLKTNFWATFVILTGSLATMSIDLAVAYKKNLFYIGLFWDFILFLLLIICIKKISIYIDALNRSKKNEQ